MKSLIDKIKGPITKGLASLAIAFFSFSCGDLTPEKPGTIVHYVCYCECEPEGYSTKWDETYEISVEECKSMCEDECDYYCPTYTHCYSGFSPRDYYVYTYEVMEEP